MADDASSPMMSVTDDTDNGRTSSICERSPTQKALKGKKTLWFRSWMKKDSEGKRVAECDVGPWLKEFETFKIGIRK